MHEKKQKQAVSSWKQWGTSEVVFSSDLKSPERSIVMVFGRRRPSQMQGVIIQQLSQDVNRWRWWNWKINHSYIFTYTHTYTYIYILLRSPTILWKHSGSFIGQIVKWRVGIWWENLGAINWSNARMLVIVVMFSMGECLQIFKKTF